MPGQVTFPKEWEQPQIRGMVASQTPPGPPIVHRSFQNAPVKKREKSRGINRPEIEKDSQRRQKPELEPKEKMNA